MKTEEGKLAVGLERKGMVVEKGEWKRKNYGEKGVRMKRRKEKRGEELMRGK